jgi:hypothetical protein
MKRTDTHRYTSLLYSVVGSGATLQAKRSRVRFPLRSLNFYILRNHSNRIMTMGSTQPLTEMSTRNLPRVWNATGTYGWQPYRHLCADCLENMEASTSHKPIGLHGLLQGFTLLFINYFTLTLESVHRGVEKFLPFPISYYPICSTTKRMFVGWVKEFRRTKS